jgi:molybdate transport system substrate-binding protein
MRAATAVLAGFLLGAPASAAPKRPQLVVSAAASLADAFQQIKARYIQEHPGVDVVLNLGSSGVLALQITRGAPADVFAAAGMPPMLSLLSQGMVDSNEVKIFARNQLVLIVPAEKRGPREAPADSSLSAPAAKDSVTAGRAAGDSAATSRPKFLPGPTGFLAELLDPKVRRIALGDEQTVPAGQYAAQSLRRFGIYEQIKSKLVPAQDVRQVLEYVATGAVDAGFVYTTDVKIEEPVRVLARIPAGAHAPIVYPIAVLKESEQTEKARDFVAFVLGPRGQEILAGQGFLPPIAPKVK